MLRLRTLGTLELVDEAGAVLSTQPKRLALLGYLLLEGSESGISREVLQALFWPELDKARAQHALRQALYGLRREADRSLFVQPGGRRTAVDSSQVTCDALEFRVALAAGRDRDALALFEGEFLAGVHLRDAPEWERWMDRVGERLREEASDAAGREAAQAVADGDFETAIAFARRRVELAPFQEKAHRELMSLLAESENRGAAVRAYRHLETTLRTELESEPSAPTRELFDRIREAGAEAGSVHGPGETSRDPAPPPIAVVDAPIGQETPRADLAPPPASRAPVASPARESPTRERTLGRRAWVASAAAVVTLLGALYGAIGWGPSEPEPVVLAVTSILDLREAPLGPPAVGNAATPANRVGQGSDGDASDRGLEEFLSAGISRAPDLRVIGGDRLSELAWSGADRVEDRVDAAVRAGANGLLEGELRGTEGEDLFLDLRLVDPGSGAVLRDWRVHGEATVGVLADAVRAVVLSAGSESPGQEAPFPGSEAAYRLYREGLRAFYAGDVPGARTLFNGALAEDSTLALAAYHLARSWEDDAGWATYLERARRLAAIAPERDRLRIQAAWSLRMSERSAALDAARLAERYPDDPDGPYFLGRALHQDGRYAEAVVQLERVVAADSLGLSGAIRECRGCDAISFLIETHLHRGDGEAAERWARAGVEVRPASARGWRELGWVLWRLGRWEEAIEARRTATSLQPALADDLVFPAVAFLRAGRFDESEASLRGLESRGDPDLRAMVLWWKVQYHRERAQRNRAVETALELRRHDEARGRLAPGSAHIVHAITLMEAGQPVRAAILFDSVRVTVTAEPPSPAHGIRQEIWLGTHAAHARAMAGDTIGLDLLADSFRVRGLRSGYVRDRVLHHHLRGLLFEARGNLPEAEREYRAAHFSRWSNYTLSTHRLAEVLLAQGKSDEAIPFLEDALKGPMMSVGLYLPRTALYEQLTDALIAAGRPEEAEKSAAFVRTARGASVEADLITAPGG